MTVPLQVKNDSNTQMKTSATLFVVVESSLRAFFILVPIHRIVSTGADVILNNISLPSTTRYLDTCVGELCVQRLDSLNGGCCLEGICTTVVSL